MRVTLEDVCEKGASNLKQSDVVSMTGEYPIYGAAGYLGNVDFYHQEKPYVAIVKDGAGIGRTTLHPAKSSVIGTMQYLLPKDNVLPEYLYYVVRHMHLEKYFTGATIPHIYFRDYKNEKFNLDSLDKQAKIVEILGKAELIILKRRQQLAELGKLIKARFVELFGTIHDNRFGFSVVTLQDVSAPIKDGTHQTPTYTTDVENGYKFLSSKDVTAGKVDWSHLKYIPEELHRELYARISPRKGDILLAKNGTTGIAAIVDRDEVFDIYVSLALIRPLGVEPTYLWAAINAAETKQQFDASLKGIGVPNLHLGEIKKARIILPPMELQEQFAAFVEQTDKSKVAVQKALDEAQLLFDSLMQKYFG